MQKDDQGAPRPLTRRAKLAFAALLFLLVMVPAFCVVETWYTMHGAWVNLDALTSSQAGTNPDALWAITDAFSAYRGRAGATLRASHGTKTVNAHGFISTPPLEVAKAPRVVRLVFLGGSSTAGPDLADAETWPWRAVEELRRYPDLAPVDFINGALAGYTTFESIGRLWSRLRFFAPDVVVVFHGWNELYYFDSPTLDRIEDWRSSGRDGWSLSTDATLPPVYQPLFIDRFVRWSNLLSTVRIRLSTPSNPERGRGGRSSAAAGLPSRWDPRGLEVWRYNLRLLRAITDVLGARLVVVKQATLIHPNLPPDQRQRCRVQLHGFDYEAHLEAFDALWRVVDEEIPAADQVDARTLSGVPEYFSDHVHQTPEGAAAVGQLVAKALVPVVQERRSRP